MPVRKPVTLADVARAAGVAKSTASYAFSDPGRLSPETTKAVHDAAATLGYYGPSALGRALASGRTHVVAVVTRALLEAPDTDPHALEVIDGLSRELTALGYGVLLLPPITDDASRRLHGTALYDAAVTVRRIEGIPETDAQLEHRGVPWIRLDGGSDEHRAVAIDHTSPSVELLRAVLDAGHRRIATVTLRPSPDLTESVHLEGSEVSNFLAEVDHRVTQRVPRQRLQAFLQLGVTPSHLVSCRLVSRQEAYAVGMHLLSLPADERPTAIVCQADTFAWGVWEAAKDLGLRVPEDVSITGFDGLRGGVFDQMRLTTVVQDGVLKGRIIAKWIATVADGEPEPEPQELPLSLRWGSTLGPAPRAESR